MRALPAHRPLLIGHRGGAVEAPENTLHAFQHAVSCGAQMIELDLHAAVDGAIVVIHDPTLDRTTDGTGAVAQQRLPDIRTRDAAHWFAPGLGSTRAATAYPLRGVATGARPPPEGVDPDRLRVPTLAEALEALRDVWITMELKSPHLHERVAEHLDAYGRAGDVIVSGFAPARLEPFRRYAPHVATSATQPEVTSFWGWAHGGGTQPAIAYEALQVPTTHDGIEVVTPAFVECAHEQGIAVHVWTIDDPGEMHRLLDLGVDGIMTDRPSVLAAVYRERADG